MTFHGQIILVLYEFREEHEGYFRARFFAAAITGMKQYVYIHVDAIQVYVYIVYLLYSEISCGHYDKVSSLT